MIIWVNALFHGGNLLKFVQIGCAFTPFPSKMQALKENLRFLAENGRMIPVEKMVLRIIHAAQEGKFPFADKKTGELLRGIVGSTRIPEPSQIHYEVEQSGAVRKWFLNLMKRPIPDHLTLTYDSPPSNEAFTALKRLFLTQGIKTSRDQKTIELRHRDGINLSISIFWKNILPVYTSSFREDLIPALINDLRSNVAPGEDKYVFSDGSETFSNKAIVAMAGAKPIGCILMLDRYEELTISEIFVAPEFRRQGIATAMMDQLFNEFRNGSLNPKPIIMPVSYDNHPGQYFLKAQGFFGIPQSSNDTFIMKYVLGEELTPEFFYRPINDLLVNPPLQPLKEPEDTPLRVEGAEITIIESTPGEFRMVIQPAGNVPHQLYNGKCPHPLDAVTTAIRQAFDNTANSRMSPLERVKTAFTNLNATPAPDNNPPGFSK